MRTIASRRLFADQSGSILLLVGLSLLFLFGIAGAGYDLGHQQLVRQKLQQSVDAAALAAANMPTTATTAERQATGQRYFALNYPATYLDVARPAVTVTPTATDVQVTLASPLNIHTSFVSNLGIPTLPVVALSEVLIANSTTSDYDVAMVVDESGSEITPSPPFTTREAAQQSALRTMVNAVLPTGSTNQNVRMGFIGFSGEVTNRWGLSNKNSDAMNAINQLRPLDQNYDHMALLAAAKMLKGGSGGVTNTTIGGGYGDNTVANNTAMPVPRTPRSTPGDSNGISNTKFVVFISDGGIMLEPGDAGPGSAFWNAYLPIYGLSFVQGYYDLTGLVHAHCPGRSAFDTECFAAFSDACTQLRNVGGTDNVHVFIINLNTPVTGPELSTLSACASPTLPGGPTYTAAEKPNAAVDFYYAANSAELASILTSVTSVITKLRIAL